MATTYAMTDYTKLGIKNICVVDGKNALIDLRTHNTKTFEEIEGEFWDAFLQGWDDDCEYDPEGEWLAFLREYADEVVGFINGVVKS